jgi:hypothetical protein
MGYFLIEDADGCVIVDETDAIHLYFTREDVEFVIGDDEELDPLTDLPVEVELREPTDEDGDEDQLFLIRDREADEMLTTSEERGDHGLLTYVMAFLEPEQAQAFIDGEFAAAAPEAAKRAEIVHAVLVRVEAA